MDKYEMYESGMSISEVSKATGLSMSTIRLRLKKAGILRTRSEGIKNASKLGKMNSKYKGCKRVFTEEWKSNISKARTGSGVGTSKKKNGYVVYTMGEHNGRLVHVVKIEKEIGRRLYSNECVHHIDEDKSNNERSNLKLMTRSEHARLHAIQNVKDRDRNSNGRFK